MKKLKAVSIKTLLTLTKLLTFLSSYQDTLKHKINTAKTLEDKILELEDDPATIEAMFFRTERWLVLIGYPL